MNTSKSAPLVTCPHCGRESLWDTNNRFRPFCCERCKMIDLGKWADEAFRVAVPDGHVEYDNPDSEVGYARLPLA